MKPTDGNICTWIHHRFQKIWSESKVYDLSSRINSLIWGSAVLSSLFTTIIMK